MSYLFKKIFILNIITVILFSCNSFILADDEIDNVDVKDNYIVTIDDATITINKETLVIDLVNISKTYDNKEFTNEDVKYQVKTNLPDNHQVKASEISIIGYEETNYPYVGSYEYIASFNVIFNDVDVTDNFDVTVNKAGATIKKFDLTITLLPLTKTYDDGYYVIENLSDVLYYDKTLPENVILKKGKEGILVTILQATLTCQGYSCNGIDGDFGNGCHKAVVALQKKHGLTQDGIVGKKTWCVIYD